MFRGKVAVIVESKGRIGEEAAKLLSSQGCDVVLSGLNRVRLELDESKVHSFAPSAQIFSIQANSSREIDVRNLFQRIKDQFNRLDILILDSSRSGGPWMPIEDISMEDYNKIFEDSIRTIFLNVKYAVPLMKKHRSGSIVIVSSFLDCEKSNILYATSRATQVDICRSLALELVSEKIRVNTVCPGLMEGAIEEINGRKSMEDVDESTIIETGQIKEYTTPTQVAKVIQFLCSDDSTSVTGTSISVDGSTTPSSSAS